MAVAWRGVAAGHLVGLFLWRARQKSIFARRLVLDFWERFIPGHRVWCRSVRSPMADRYTYLPSELACLFSIVGA